MGRPTTRRRCRAAAVAAGMVLATLPLMPATADNPAMATATTGQDMTIAISSPVGGDTVPLPNGPITISGTAAIQDLADATEQLDAAFAIDLSGSTGSPSPQDCDGNGVAGNAGDDFNGRLRIGDTADCEISGVLQLAHSLVPRPNTTFAALPFATRAALADLDPAANVQTSVDPTLQDTTAGQPAFEVAFRSMSWATSNSDMHVRRYTPMFLSGGATNFQSVLEQAITYFSSRPASTRVLYMLTDGLPTEGHTDFRPGTPGGNLAAQLGALGVRVEGYAIGSQSSRCLTSSQTADPRRLSLWNITTATGGTCTFVLDPTTLGVALTDPVTIDAVQVTVNGTPVSPVALNPDGTWSADFGGALVAGTNLIEATLVASDGTTATADVTVTGDAVPTADAGPDLSVPEGGTVVLQGSGADPGDTVSFLWTPGDDLDDPTLAQPTLTALDDCPACTYTLTVSDTTGNSATDATDVTIQNVAPTLVVDVPSVVNAGEPFQVDVSGTDPGVADTHTVLVWDGSATHSPPVAQAAGSYSASQTLTLTDPGTTTLHITATDDDGGTTTRVIVVEVNQAPQVDAGGPYTVDEGATVAFDATVTDAEGDGHTVSWSVPSLGTLSSTTVEDPTYTAVDDLDETLTLTATDEHGAASSQTTQLTVNNVAPTLAPPAFDVSTAQPGDVVHLGLDWSDPGSLDTFAIVIDWGDGSSTTVPTGPGATTATVGHAYSTAGTHMATAEVCDDDMGCASGTATIVVNTPPDVTLPATAAVTEGSSVVLPATITDADGDMLTISWTDPSGRLLDPTVAQPLYYGADDLVETLTVTATDGVATASAAIEVTTTNLAPSIIDGAATPAGGTTAMLAFGVQDPGLVDTHSALIDWGDGSSTTLPLGDLSGGVSQTHDYGTPGTFTIAVHVTDDDGASTSESFQVTVNTPPTVTAVADLSVAEGSSATIAATATDADGDALTFAWTPGGHPDHSTLDDPSLLTPTVTALDDGSQPYTLVANDGFADSTPATTMVHVTNVAPTIDTFTYPTDPTRLGDPVTVAATSADPGTLDIHSFTVQWGDGAMETGAATGGVVDLDHTYATAGVYTIVLTICDDDDGCDSRMSGFVVVYDPDGGFVTGGGHIHSPAGAYTPDPTLEGTASFGFVSKYKKGSSVPEGNTQFQFRAADLNFHSTSYEWMVISGERAQFRGAGTINGTGDHTFALTAFDSDPDRFRIQIWDADGTTIYDNHAGTDGGTELRGGSIQIHSQGSP